MYQEILLLPMILEIQLLQSFLVCQTLHLRLVFLVGLPVPSALVNPYDPDHQLLLEVLEVQGDQVSRLVRVVLLLQLLPWLHSTCASVPFWNPSREPSERPVPLGVTEDLEVLVLQAGLVYLALRRTLQVPVFRVFLCVPEVLCIRMGLEVPWVQDGPLSQSHMEPLPVLLSDPYKPCLHPSRRRCWVSRPDRRGSTRRLGCTPSHNWSPRRTGCRRRAPPPCHKRRSGRASASRCRCSSRSRRPVRSCRRFPDMSQSKAARPPEKRKSLGEWRSSCLQGRHETSSCANQKRGQKKGRERDGKREALGVLRAAT